MMTPTSKIVLFSSFFSLLAITGVAIALIVTIKPLYRNYGWNTEIFKNHMDNSKTFIAYYGWSECPFCKKFEDYWKNRLGKVYIAVEKTKKKMRNPNLILGFKEDYKKTSSEYEKRTTFNNYLSKTFSSTDVAAKNSQITYGDWYVPMLIFVKKGKLFWLGAPGNINDNYATFVNQLKLFSS